MGLPSNLGIAPRLGTYTSLHRLAAVPDEISMPIGALIPASSLSSCPSFSMCSFHDRLALVRRHSWPVPICVLVGFKQYARKQIVWGTAHTHTNTHTHTRTRIDTNKTQNTHIEHTYKNEKHRIVRKRASTCEKMSSNTNAPLSLFSMRRTEREGLFQSKP